MKKLELLKERMKENGYKVQVNPSGEMVAWYKVGEGVLHYIPVNSRILQNAVEFMDEPEPFADDTIVFGYEIRLFETGGKWQINWDEEDLQTMYCDGWVPFMVEMIFAHWQNDYETFGTRDNVWLHGKYFRDIFEKFTDREEK